MSDDQDHLDDSLLNATDLNPDVETVNVMEDFSLHLGALNRKNAGGVNHEMEEAEKAYEKRKARIKQVKRAKSTSPDLFDGRAKVMSQMPKLPVLRNNYNSPTQQQRGGGFKSQTPEPLKLDHGHHQHHGYHRGDADPFELSLSKGNLDSTVRSLQKDFLGVTPGRGGGGNALPKMGQTPQAGRSPQVQGLRTPQHASSPLKATAAGRAQSKGGSRKNSPSPTKRSPSPFQEPPPTYHEIQKRKNVAISADTLKYQAGMSVITQLERTDTTQKEANGDRMYVTEAALKKQQKFEDDMSQKLEKYLHREDRRQGAMKGRLQKETEDRQKLWLTVETVAASASVFIRAIRVARAKKALREHFVIKFLSYIRRKHALEARAEKVKEREAQMLLRPTKEDLKKVECLACLPDSALEQLIAGMGKRCHLASEYLIYEGRQGTEALILHKGKVEIRPQRRPPASIGTAGAHLRLQPQIDVTGVNEPGWVIGETLLITEEPYEHGIVAVEDTDVWTVPRSLYMEVVQGVTHSQVKETVFRLIDDRRAVNMLRYRSMTEQFVRTASPLFTLWSQQGVARVLKCVRPTIFRRGDQVVGPGQYGKAIVFIVQGRVELIVDGKRTEVVREGQAIAEVCVALGRRDKKTSVRAIQNTDCWVLEKADYQSIVAHETVTNIMPAMLSLVDENGKERERAQRTKVAADE